MPSPLIVISGASGSGKTTLCRMVANDLGFYYSISHTTRPKRPNETQGVDYYFVDRPHFQEMIKRGDFLEWAEVYHNLYGTSRSLIEQYRSQGRGVIVDVDTQGALAIKQKCPEAKLVFILAPSLEELKKRLASRATDSDEVQVLRMAQAMKEEAQSSHFDYRLINNDLNSTFADLKKIIPVQS